MLTGIYHFTDMVKGHSSGMKELPYNDIDFPLTKELNAVDQDVIFTFPTFPNLSSCKLCQHLSLKFPSHPFCSSHSLCRAGVNIWTPSLCGACIVNSNLIISSFAESLELKKLMLKSLDLSLKRLQKLNVHPKNWTFKTDFYNSLREICFSPAFPPDLYIILCL